MAWRRSGDKPLSEPRIVSLLTHRCVTRPQWVKYEQKKTSQSNMCLLWIRSLVYSPHLTCYSLRLYWRAIDRDYENWPLVCVNGNRCILSRNWQYRLWLQWKCHFATIDEYFVKITAFPFQWSMQLQIHMWLHNEFDGEMRDCIKISIVRHATTCHESFQ